MKKSKLVNIPSVGFAEVSDYFLTPEEDRILQEYIDKAENDIKMRRTSIGGKVAKLYQQGKTIREIADILQLSHHCVKAVQNIIITC